MTAIWARVIGIQLIGGSIGSRFERLISRIMDNAFNKQRPERGQGKAPMFRRLLDLLVSRWSMKNAKLF